MSNIKTHVYYEATDGKQFNDREYAEVYQEHLDNMQKVNYEFEKKIKDLVDKATNKFYGGR